MAMGAYGIPMPGVCRLSVCVSVCVCVNIYVFAHHLLILNGIFTKLGEMMYLGMGHHPK